MLVLALHLEVRVDLELAVDKWAINHFEVHAPFNYELIVKMGLYAQPSVRVDIVYLLKALTSFGPTGAA